METIYRLPPYRVDSEVLAASGSQKIDWGLLAHGIPEEWAGTQGEDVVVAVLDTGASDHNDLPEPEFKFNFTSSRTPMDRNGHSTHVAGIIGGRNNDYGVVGVGPQTKIGYCKVLGDDGSGSSTWIAKGIRAAVEAGANIVNMSIGGGYSREVHDAVKYANSKKVFCFAAAGNSGYSGRDSIDYPGGLAETLTIGSYKQDGSISRFSSGGNAMDVCFPGERIYSCYPGNQYRIMSGTSMATPFAAGVAALIISAYKLAGRLDELTGHQAMRSVLINGADDRGPAGKDPRWGFGVPNIDGILPEVDPEPDDEFYFG